MKENTQKQGEGWKVKGEKKARNQRPETWKNQKIKRKKEKKKGKWTFNFQLIPFTFERKSRNKPSDKEQGKGWEKDSQHKYWGMNQGPSSRRPILSITQGVLIV